MKYTVESTSEELQITATPFSAAEVPLVKYNDSSGKRKNFTNLYNRKKSGGRTVYYRSDNMNGSDNTIQEKRAEIIDVLDVYYKANAG